MEMFVQSELLVEGWHYSSLSLVNTGPSKQVESSCPSTEVTGIFFFCSIVRANLHYSIRICDISWASQYGEHIFGLAMKYT